jgi:hypothetical protein
MNNLKLLRTFFEKSMNDRRLAPCHISLYLGIFQRWVAGNFKNPMVIIKNDLMRLSKLNGNSTYYKVIRELHDFGYIEYFPASGRHEQSFVKMTPLDVVKCIVLVGLKLKLAL